MSNFSFTSFRYFFLIQSEENDGGIPLILILIIPPRFLSLAIFFDSLFSAREENGNLERNLSTGGHFVDIGRREEEGLDVFQVCPIFLLLLLLIFF